jgi:predicted O-methyltransferase YrrM
MEFEEAARIVDGVPPPHIPASRGRLLYQHITKTRPLNVLELGTARGGSAVFLASALEANGAGHLTSVDSTRWNWRDPTPQEVLDKAGLSHRVTFDRRFSTYSWFLKTEIEKCLTSARTVRPEYDFIFIDGAKNWSTDGIAVVTAEKLLKPGGWLLLDDLGWSYAEHAQGSAWHYEIEIAKLSGPERTEPHLQRVLDLLIKTNPAFDEIVEDGWWGWAHKADTAGWRHLRGGVLSGGPAPGARGRAAMRRYGRLARRGLHDPRRAAARLTGRG